MSPKILCFSGSTRSGAYSTATLNAVSAELADAGALVTRISLSDYPMPILNEDDEREHGQPDAARRLARLMSEHDGFLICSPEYNASIPPLLKNTIDWLSRVKSDSKGPVSAFGGKVAAICGSSPGRLGGMRMLPHLRQVLMNVGLQIITEQVSVGDAKTAFDAEGKFVDERTAKLARALAKELVYRANEHAYRVR